MQLLWSLLALLYTYTSAHQDLHQLIAQLETHLSSGAVVTFPWDPRWTDLQTRASWPRLSPEYNVVVEVATESDVQATVSLADRYNIPFLAVSGGHGWSNTLKKFPYGIQINMRRMNAATLSADGKTAFVGGGMLQHELVTSLFTKGKYAVTGICECTSLVGPLLGGGHSFLQGQYGFALDGLVSARVALASGKVVTASRSQNSDLFWALRGAGHNFGIVTSLEVKVYDIKSNWTVYTLVYTSDKVEALFDLVNEFERPGKERPAKLALIGVATKIPAIDPNKPVVAYNVLYEGPLASAESYAALFKSLGPVQTTILTDVPYHNLYKLTGNGINDQACVDKQNLVGNGISLPSWTAQDVRTAFSIFTNITTDPRFSNSIILMENYGMKGVRSVEAALTALPVEERELPILAGPVLWWEGNDAKDVDDAYAYIDALSDALFRSVEKRRRHTYVNYAFGGEAKEQIYGYDWRPRKLARLKREWDPRGRFGFFNSVV